MSESGYLINEEDRDFLDSLPLLSQDVLFSDGGYQEIRLDPRKLIRIENQGSQGSCAGHSLSSILEWCHTVATGGDVIQYSRAMAYYEAQRISGIRGDSGSTISAGVKLGMQTGLCIEELWKYPPRYDNTRPANYQAVLDNASKNKVGSATKITTYESYRVFLGAGLGGVHNGIAWGNGMNRQLSRAFPQEVEVTLLRVCALVNELIRKDARMSGSPTPGVCSLGQGMFRVGKSGVLTQSAKC